MYVVREVTYKVKSMVPEPWNSFSRLEYSTLRDQWALENYTALRDQLYGQS